MTKLVFTYILLLLCNNYFCQDTIFTKSQNPLLVRVLEIYGNGVKYKNYFNPDGIVYDISNNQIVKIVYENGKVESKFELLQKASGSKEKNITSNAFIIEGKHISLNNQDISNKAAFKHMLKRDAQLNSDDLNSMLLNAESKHNGFVTLSILTPAFAFGGLLVARRNYYGPNDQAQAQTFILTGLGLSATSFISAQIVRSIRNKHIRKAALLYNTEL